jgi:glycosyltransferase involved in cell wall biosynthesis
MADATILQVVPRVETGGSEQTTVEIAEALARSGARGLVATEGGRMATAITQHGGEIVTMPVASKNPITMFANAGRLVRLIERRGVDLVHARSRAPAWSALIAARRTGRPFVATYHGAYGNPGLIKNFYNSVMARGDRVIANSHYTADLIAARHGVTADRLRVIYRGVDAGQFDPAAITPGAIAELRAQWGVAPNARVVLQAARITGLKGHRVTIEAAALMQSEGALGNTVVVMAGDAPRKGAYRRELMDSILRHRLEETVLLVGHCSEMPAAFLTADVTIMPSLVPETFGRTSIEAQAMGCPVIVSELGALPETVIPPSQDAKAFTGWLVPADDAAALAAKIKLALALPPRDRAALGVRARRQAAKFSLAQMQRATLAVYDELLGTRLAERFGGVPAEMA